MGPLGSLTVQALENSARAGAQSVEARPRKYAWDQDDWEGVDTPIIEEQKETEVDGTDRERRREGTLDCERLRAYLAEQTEKEKKERHMKWGGRYCSMARAGGASKKWDGAEVGRPSCVFRKAELVEEEEAPKQEEETEGGRQRVEEAAKDEGGKTRMRGRRQRGQNTVELWTSNTSGRRSWRRSFEGRRPTERREGT